MKRNMAELTYGIRSPLDLLEKLKQESRDIGAFPEPFKLFNFILTAAALNEWTLKVYSEAISDDLENGLCRKTYEGLPVETENWIIDKNCLPNSGCDVRKHVFNVLSICWGTANASKHFHWTKDCPVVSIDEEPIIDDFYKYFFTSISPGIYIDIAGEYYNVEQIRDILLQFYPKLLEYLEAMCCADSM